MHLQVAMCTLTWSGMSTHLGTDTAQTVAHGLLPALCRVSSAEALTHSQAQGLDKQVMPCYI